MIYFNSDFDGVKISDPCKIQTPNHPQDLIIVYSWTHVKEIPNTKLLVSLQHNWEKAANLEIFDISKKDRINNIYSFGEVSGSSIIYLNK